MLSDTIHDGVAEMIESLARYYVNDDYTQDQIEEAVRRLVPISAMGTYLDIGGDGVLSDNPSDDTLHPVRGTISGWVHERLWKDLYEEAAKIDPRYGQGRYVRDLPSLVEYLKNEGEY